MFYKECVQDKRKQESNTDYLRLSEQFVFWFLCVLSLPLPQLATEKADSSYMLEIDVEMFKIQEHLARLYTRLEGHHQTKAQAEAKHRQAQDRLDEIKSQFSNITSQDRKAKANGETVLQCRLMTDLIHDDDSYL